MLKAENLSCRRGAKLVFRNIGITANAGDAVMVMGANGSGKSSLLRVLASLLAPEDGTIFWRDTPIENDIDAHRARIHYIGHLDALKPELTVSETVSYWNTLYGSESSSIPLPFLREGLGVGQDVGNPESPSPAKTNDLLRKSKFSSPLSRYAAMQLRRTGCQTRRSLGIAGPQGERNKTYACLSLFGLTPFADKPVRYLSAGQKRRLSLSRLALGNAPLWLLDEPTTSLDAEGQKFLNEALAQHRGKGGIALIASHHAIDVPDMRKITMSGAA